MIDLLLSHLTVGMKMLLPLGLTGLSGVLLSAVLATVQYALHILSNGQRITPDGIMYLQLSRRESVPTPYCKRWALPLILGPSVTSWRVNDFVMHILTSLLIYTGVLWVMPTPWLAVLATVLLNALPMCRLWANYPVLVDRTAFMILICVWLISLKGGSFLILLLLVTLGAFVKESVPLFATALTLNPIYLLPYLIVYLLPILSKKEMLSTADIPKGFEWLATPIRSAFQQHRSEWMDGAVMILPWGAFLLGVPVLLETTGTGLLVLGLTLILAYGQLLVGNDTVRLYQWAVIPLLIPVVSVVSTMSPMLVAVLVVSHLMNPWGARVQV